ncbi:hypothetical protein pE33L466_0395 (plasmid) [Bacillus cereus E33L]|uniref:Uncharacterized protein n=1 Tax=Bacillus cereus (strain ZK / E33L) TaxID=288681 RepID=Q4V171_BACCZ|nr:hypothetical protein pE33L466_0395 [Bacillus cereus E33L]
MPKISSSIIVIVCSIIVPVNLEMFRFRFCWFMVKKINFFDHAKLLHGKLPCNELEFIDNVKHQIPTKAAKGLNEMIKQFVFIHTEMNREEMFSLSIKE